MAQKPSIPKGTRDFSALEVARRQYIISIITQHFRTYGFMPIETPSFENLETLLGKYGEEGDRLIFKILNSGEKVKKADVKALEEQQYAKFANSLSEKALRYDLTVPFARYVVQHQNEIDFPFKRYQIQPVWRADNPQKGRFREFYQCDADVVGSNSLLQEVEFIQLYDAVFTQLGVEGVTIKINNRKILSGFAEVFGIGDQLIDFTVALDKLDKIGVDGVKNEMLQKGINQQAIEKMNALFVFSGNLQHRIEQLKEMLKTSEEGLKGVEELAFIVDIIEKLGLSTAQLELDITLARGLNYYTGAIFEISAPKQVKMGSIGGGGRYDDLTGIFGLKNVSGVGISFGLDRIYLVMEELDLFPKDLGTSSEVLFLNMGDQEVEYVLPLIKKMRQQGVKVELYPDKAKIGKQFQFADKKNIRYAIVVGTTEMEQEKYMLKNLASGEQQLLSEQEIINVFK